MLDHLVLLPGLDGTGRLFRGFLEVMPARFTVDVKRYPPDVASYEDLESRLRSSLPEARPFWLIAESFSGPLAVRLGAGGLSGLLGIVLVCSFVRSPRPFWLRVLPWSLLCRLPAPVVAVRWAFTGWRASPEFVREAAAVQRGVKPAVAAARLRLIMRVDESKSLGLCAVPILYLQALRDRLVHSNSARHIQRIKPDTQLTVLDTSHLLLQTAQVSAWSAIEHFIDGHRPAA